MPLIPNSRLGPYEILQPIGAGGMGQVYKARDTRLNRTVAIKVLPPEFASRPDWKQRFEREAQTIASLNHPHICTLYDVGQQEGIDYLVMEFLEGQTLAQRLERGALPLDEALKIAIEIADALDKAHRQGIVHRDLKPANVMLTKMGVKLLDFGLAKPPSHSASLQNSDMPTGRNMTAEGMIVGTLQYMAPEQLEGREADARADIFAFGAVFYEMVVGRKAFEGRSQASLIASILSTNPPPISSIQPIVPKSLDSFVKHCLSKSPEDRWQTIADMLFQLRGIAEGGSQPDSVADASQKSKSPLLWMAASGLLCATIVAAAAFLIRAKPADPSRISFEVTFPQGASALQIALSPDGKYLVDGAAGGIPLLSLRSLDSVNVRGVPGSDHGVYPFWSPDSHFIGFFADQKLKKIGVSGGPAQTLCDVIGAIGGAWNTDGVIIFGARGGLGRVAASGGPATRITELDASREEIAHIYPSFLPDGKHFVFVAVSKKTENNGLYVSSLDSKERKRILPTSLKATFVSPNLIVFMQGSTLMAQPFDTRRLELNGDPFQLVEGVSVNPGNWLAGYTVSDGGTLAYRSGGGPASVQVVWFDRLGNQIDNIGTDWGSVELAVSPDFQRVALSNAGLTGSDLWIYDVNRRVGTRFTFSPEDAPGAPLWSPSGTRIAYTSHRGANNTGDLYIKDSSGGSTEEVLLKTGNYKEPYDWSADGRTILYGENNPKTGFDLWTLPITAEGKPGSPQPLLQTRFNERDARFSPDGKWIVYASDESGQYEIYVRSFPAPTAKYQISSGGGSGPQWRRDGKEIFFLSPTREMMAADVSFSKDRVLVAGIPRRLFQSRARGQYGDAYAVTPDGQRFLVSAQSETVPVTVIVNWMSHGSTQRGH